MNKTKKIDPPDKMHGEIERRLRHVQALAHIGDWEWDLATNAVYWSDELYRIYGFDPQEAPPDYNIIQRHLHPDSKDEFQQAIDAALKGEKPFDINYSIFRRNGDVAILHGVGEVMRDDSGAPERMTGIVQDISEQKRAEISLKISEGKFRTIFENANDGILIADAENRNFIDANQAICRILGYTKDELLRMAVPDIHPVESLQAVEETFDSLRCGQVSVAGNIPVKRKDTTLFFVDISGAVVEIGGKGYLVGIFHDITERRETEEKLKIQGKHLAESQRIAHIGSWEHNLATNEAFWSAELFRLLGLDPETDKEDFDLFLTMVHPEDRQLLQNAIKNTVQLHKPFNIDYRFILRDGTQRILRAMAELIPDSNGNQVILSGTAQDVTERKLAEDRLYEKNTMLQTLINAIPDVVIFKDDRGRYLLANKAMEESCGIGQEELIGMTDEKLSSPEVAEKCRKSDEEAIRKGGPFYSDESYIDGNGETRFLDVVKCPIRDNYGDLKGLVMVSRDITDRKRVEQRIQKSEEYIRNILNTVDEGFIVVDRNFRIQSVNHAYCDQLGLNENQVIGKHCYEVSHNHSRPCHEEGEECSVKEVFEKGEPYITYHRHEDAEGNIIYVETKAFPLTDTEGTVTQAIETITDITEKRLLEAERLKVQKLEAIGTLAGGIAHDFNNLLQGVFGYISMAKIVSGNNSEAVAALDDAEKALHLTVRMTNQLLTFSKGGKPIKAHIDPRVVIDNAVRFSLSGSSIACTVVNAKDLWQVEADEGQITQVIQNIILNAAQAMSERGRIDISTKNIFPEGPELLGRPGGGKYVEIVIQDHGTGIHKEDLSRIFDPYFTTKENGNGLGLATSFSIVKNHGGWIKVESIPGEGTTFFVYLPATDTIYKKIQSKSKSDKHSRLGKILVMDDEPMICQIAGALINMLGHTVDFAKDGEEALAKYQAGMRSGNPFDAVILDLTVRGGLGGEETILKLREIDPNVKAVVSSGYADSDVIANHRDYGFTAFLNKPYDVSRLQYILHEVLSTESMAKN